MDGFDMDEVFGQGSVAFTSQQSSQIDSQETIVPPHSTRAKRGHEVEEEEEEGGEDSEMMEDTEPEDEGEGWNTTVVPVRKVRGAGGGARRTFKSAQSQPTLSFSTPF